MPVEQLVQTVLSEPLTDNQDTFKLFSYWSSVKIGDFIVCRSEAMKVVDLLANDKVRVVRGVAGTRAIPHPTGHKVYIGAPGKFKAVRDSLTALIGEHGTYPDFLLPGQRATDAAGNEYVLLNSTTTIYSGSTVLISRDQFFNCGIPTPAAQGSIAVTVEQATSDQYVWGQIYGYNAYCQDGSGTSEVTSNYMPVVQSSISTPYVGMAAIASPAGAYAIHGMFIVGEASSATTSASSATGTAVPVWLNYPYITHYPESSGLSLP